MTIGLGHLGWSPAIFWDASVDEVLLAWDGYQERQRRADARFGQFMALYANSKRDSKERPEPFTPRDFFPSLADPDSEEHEADEETNGVMELTPEVFAMLNRDPEPAKQPDHEEPES